MYVMYLDNMLSIAKQLLINKLNLPKEIIDIVKNYTFHKIKKYQKMIQGIRFY